MQANTARKSSAFFSTCTSSAMYCLANVWIVEQIGVFFLYKYVCWKFNISEVLFLYKYYDAL